MDPLTAWQPTINRNGREVVRSQLGLGRRGQAVASRSDVQLLLCFFVYLVAITWVCGMYYVNSKEGRGREPHAQRVFSGAPVVSLSNSCCKRAQPPQNVNSRLLTAFLVFGAPFRLMW